MSELTEQDVMSRLVKLEQKMNDLDRSADALIDELESLEAVARELKLTDSVDKFNEYIEEVGQIKEDLSCKLSSLFNIFWFFFNFKRTIEFHPSLLNPFPSFGNTDPFTFLFFIKTCAIYQNYSIATAVKL